MTERTVLIREATSAEEVIPARIMQAESWLATYPDEAAGVSEQWVRERTDAWLMPERLNESVERLGTIIRDPMQFYRLAELDGEIVGFVHAKTNEDGTKTFEAIYTSPKTFGSGIGAKLMKVALEWIGDTDATLEVVTYNERARRFYEKHGFIPVAGSDHMYADTMPVITMMRKGKGA